MKAKDVALFFLLKDKSGTVFNENLVGKNGHTFYEGNAKLNKFLQLANNIYIAKTGQPIIDDSFLAYDNGGVVQSVQKEYAFLRNHKKGYVKPSFDHETEKYLDTFYKVFKNVSVDELIELSHEDEAWVEKHKNGTNMSLLHMEPQKHYAQYKKQYHDILQVMEEMGA